MPLPLNTTPEAVAPNTYRYDVSIVSRISDGQLLATVSISIHPARCDDGVWQDTYAAPVGHMIPDLDKFAAANPDLAVQIGTVYAQLNELVGAINDKLRLV